MIKIVLVALVGFLLSSCSEYDQSDSEIEKVDIPTLLANPEVYTGKRVQISGAAVVRFEANYICPHAAMIDSGNSKRCLWLASSKESVGLGIADLHRNNVELIGVFKSDYFGHFNAYGGTFMLTQAKVLSSHGLGDIPLPPRLIAPLPSN